jgi:hypothetical protein
MVAQFHRPAPAEHDDAGDKACQHRDDDVERDCPDDRGIDKHLFCLHCGRGFWVDEKVAGEERRGSIDPDPGVPERPLPFLMVEEPCEVFRVVRAPVKVIDKI